jgi:hypothetical protein
MNRDSDRNQHLAFQCFYFPGCQHKFLHGSGDLEINPNGQDSRSRCTDVGVSKLTEGIFSCIHPERTTTPHCRVAQIALKLAELIGRKIARDEFSKSALEASTEATGL